MSNYRPDNDQAAAQLIAKMKPEISEAKARGRRNYFGAYVLTVLPLVASILTGALGLFAAVPGSVLGLVALVPAAIALTLRTTKLQARAN